MTIPKPINSSGWLDNYIAEVEGNDLIREMRDLNEYASMLISKLSQEDLAKRYSPEKWSVAEVIVHMMDCERVFAYRALRFARRDKTELPGYDENLFASNSSANNRTASELLREYVAQRNSTIELYCGFSNDMLEQVGAANGIEMSVTGLGFAICGHERHHWRIIQERYF